MLIDSRCLSWSAISVKLSTFLNKHFARIFWNPLPGAFQREISYRIAPLYHLAFSRHFIKFFCGRYRMAGPELDRYLPASLSENYQSFQDFFTRRLAHPLRVESDVVWPCQGYVCDYGRVGDLPPVEVKGQLLPIRFIFNRNEAELPDDYYFANVFLHNHNYHRFHAPISGVIKKIEHLPGQLVFLRPWLYRRSKVSEPSFRNERLVIELECETTGRSWFLSFVGGMGVGQIKMTDGLGVGSSVKIGQEIGLFLLGSTCCMAIPRAIGNLPYLQPVDVGQSLV
jgi:phosphatidylserine decarboxylase